LGQLLLHRRTLHHEEQRASRQQLKAVVRTVAPSVAKNNHHRIANIFSLGAEGPLLLFINLPL